MSNGDFSVSLEPDPSREPGPRQVLHAIRQALFDDSSLQGGVPAEEIARQLIVRGYLQKQPSLALVKDMLEVLEEGSFGLRSPTPQPCAFETFWDAEAGRLRRNINLSMSTDWIGAPSTWWDRKLPEKLTHAKTPPCTDLISDPGGILRNRTRWPIHICSGEFERQSTELWAEAQRFAVDSVNAHRWASMYPLPIGEWALIMHSDVEDLSAWSEVIDVLPFEKDERAVWALRVEHGTFPTVDTLDLFGLAEYSSVGEPVAGALAYSVRGKDRFLIDVLDAADRWWAQFRGLVLRGRPKGTGTWATGDDYSDALREAVARVRSDGDKVTLENVARCFSPPTSARQLRAWNKRYGIDWVKFRQN